MTFETPPRIGNWYKNSTGESFEIVAQDEDDETLELQYYDGTVEELDRDIWEQLRPEPIEPPEDWTGSLDMAKEDYSTMDRSIETDDWLSELERFDRTLG